MNTKAITPAQRRAVAALNLPFELSDADIARQFIPNGAARPRDNRDPMDRVRGLAKAAMNDVIAANRSAKAA